ncbi:RING/U-box superfamily protein [Rhynchospora pubera]|uniref:E3 ubiquitin-protein ligase RMA n=1 Tax=Rhynchospora pubera TaxID=906938 RepID=A0AAV8EKU7_9POAL|nr:RING/U-box superfamily protein [Rhynchospora pubera]
MSSSFSGSTSTNPNPACSSSNDSTDGFSCNICFELAQDPVVTLCGHLYCWPCLYKWLRVHARSPECPVCKALLEEEKLVPLYGRGKNPTDPRSKTVPGVEIPHRPTGQRPPTAPQPDANANANPNMNPFHNVNFGGGYSFGFGTFGLFPMLSFQINGFPGAGYGFGGGYNQFGYGNPHAVHGAHAYRHNTPRDQQQDRTLKMLLIIVGVLVVASLISF